MVNEGAVFISRTGSAFLVGIAAMPNDDRFYSRLHTIVFVLLVVGVVLVVFTTSSTGGIATFSPDTLEVQLQSEIRILGGTFLVYQSRPSIVDNELLGFLIRNNFVQPIESDHMRSIGVYHSNKYWRDGYGMLYDVLIRHPDAIMEWSQAHPECARIYWEEGFALLRSNDPLDVENGCAMLSQCWGIEKTEELVSEMARVNQEFADLKR